MHLSLCFLILLPFLAVLCLLIHIFPSHSLPASTPYPSVSPSTRVQDHDSSQPSASIFTAAFLSSAPSAGLRGKRAAEHAAPSRQHAGPSTALYMSGQQPPDYKFSYALTKPFLVIGMYYLHQGFEFGRGLPFRWPWDMVYFLFETRSQLSCKRTGHSASALMHLRHADENDIHCCCTRTPEGNAYAMSG